MRRIAASTYEFRIVATLFRCNIGRKHAECLVRLEGGRESGPSQFRNKRAATLEPDGEPNAQSLRWGTLSDRHGSS